ncbi:MAG: 3-phosphoshikimate 1-carboxyvinyltransferase [Acidobacteriota bacterium]
MKLLTAPRPIDAVITPPPSKSLTHRALIAAALAPGRTRLANPLDAEDTRLTASALARLGAGVRRSSTAWWEIEGWPDGRPPPGGPPLVRLQLGNSGTSLRLLMPVAALGTRSTLFDGRPRLRRRPVGPLAAALRSRGVQVDEQGRPGCPPVIVTGPLTGGALAIDAAASSQFVSGLLLAGPRAGGPVHVDVLCLSSRPYVDLTRDVMASFGVQVRPDDRGRFEISPATYRSPGTYRVEADASAAAFLLAAGAATGGRVRVTGVGQDSPQGDRRFLDQLAAMGCSTTAGPDWMEVSGPLRHGLTADLNDTPDLVPPRAAVALLAPTPSRRAGIAHLRHKESDRLAALAAEAARLGGAVEAGPDFLAIDPAPLHGAEVAAHDDHRIAMAMAIVALRVPGMSLDDPDCVGKSYPGFFDDLARMIHGSAR